jgi:glycosyltransferase involved in cell wall biosynthesis
MVAMSPDIEFYFYIRHPDLEAVLPIAPNVCVRQLVAPLDPLWEQVALPLAARRDRVDILHSLGNTGPLFLSGQLCQVLSLMDVMFLQSGEFVPKPVTVYQRIGRWYRAIVSPRCARNADSVITISDFSKRDINKFIQGLDPSRLMVTHLACDPSFTVLGAAVITNDETTLGLRLTEPFILCLGADDPRKNTLRMVQAYLKLVRENDVAEKLVISGYKNWENSLAYKEVLKAGATDKVKFLSFVSMPELVSLYRHAILFAYPSLYEGFGLPILEAFSSGCPVIASNVTSIPEVAGDAALYFDPCSVSSIETALLQVIRDSVLRQQLIASGLKRAKQFTWAETARKTLAIYDECLEDQKI